MEPLLWKRRAFLKHAGKALGAASLFASTSGSDLEAKGVAQNAGRAEHGRPATRPAVRLNVKDFGAVGDGETKDTLAVQQALDRCNVLGGGEVLIPQGRYLTGAIVLRSNTVLRIEEQASLLGSPDLADYPLTQVRWEGKWIKGHNGYISAVDATDIAIVGKGKIIGNTAIKGRYNRQTGVRNPALLEFTSCRNVRIEDCYTAQNDMWSIHPVYCENVTFRNMTVNGNADGIDVDSCRHVVIDGCDFATGDDCISLKSGRGIEGNIIGIPTEDVRISNCTFHDQHWACIGIGSETSAGIRNVHVEHCRCLSARTFAIYIKSRPGRGAFIEDIYMDDIEVEGAQAGFLRINIANSGLQDQAPVQGDQGIPTIRNFHFSNIRVKDMPMLVDAVSIHPHKPLDGFSLTNVTGTCKKGIELANMNHVTLKNIDVTGYDGPLLRTYHVSGTGLKGAVALPEPKPAAPVPELKEPYVLR
jgi:polygalacturonase